MHSVPSCVQVTLELFIDSREHGDQAKKLIADIECVLSDFAGKGAAKQLTKWAASIADMDEGLPVPELIASSLQGVITSAAASIKEADLAVAMEHIQSHLREVVFHQASHICDDEAAADILASALSNLAHLEQCLGTPETTFDIAVAQPLVDRTIDLAKSFASYKGAASKLNCAALNKTCLHWKIFKLPFDRKSEVHVNLLRQCLIGLGPAFTAHKEVQNTEHTAFL
jgi:hypothetical protein